MCFDWPVVRSQVMQSGVSVREVTVLWSEHRAGDLELDWISFIHSVTHNVSIRTGWRTPLYSQLETQTAWILSNNHLETVGRLSFVMSRFSRYVIGLNRWRTHPVWSIRRQWGRTDPRGSWRVSLGCGRRAAHGPFAVVGPDNVAVFYTRQQGEVVVMGLGADVDDCTVSAEFVPCDDAVRVLRRSPAHLHRLWARYL